MKLVELDRRDAFGEAEPGRIARLIGASSRRERASATSPLTGFLDE